MQLKEILSKEVYYATPSNTLSEVAGLMLRHNIGAVPICDGDSSLVGIITDRDLAIESCTSDVDVRNAAVREFMTRNPITASPEMDAEDACELMAREQIRRLPVVQDGRLLGVVSLGDMAVCMPQEQCVLNALTRISTPCRVPYRRTTQRAA